MNDLDQLTNLNARFVDAFRRGSWGMLKPLFAPEFRYLDGATGDEWPMERYIADLQGNSVPAIEIDQVRVHVAGDVAAVSARSVVTPGRYSRYLETYERREHRWLCVHACVWPLQTR